MIDLKANPFYLKDEEIAWVEETLESLTEDEMVGQLFCLHGDSDDMGELKRILETYHPGAMMYRPGAAKKIYGIHKFLQEESRIPMLLAANLESGGDGIGNEGTFFGRQIQVAASGDPQQAYRLGVIAGREGAAVGCNWSFAPVVDIDMNFANPITNVRTFGSDKEQVKEMALAYMKGCQENGVAVSVKHFPGDGVDDRDQHLLSSVNSLSVEEWDSTYGDVYRAMIENGAKTIMAGHIMQPAYTRYFSPEIRDEEIMPGSLSPQLLTGLLRGKLGFNGLIVTDATSMVGFGAMGHREELIPRAIAAGCDMILFTKDLEEDVTSMKKGIADQVVTKERLHEAVTRILALKASLGLRRRQQEGTLMPPEEGLSVLKCPEHVAWARQLADESITLVKNTEQILPVDPAEKRRAMVIVLGDVVSASGKPAVGNLFIEELEKAGFEVERFDEKAHGGLFYNGPVKTLRETYDIVFYFANIKTASNQTTVRINWKPPMGLDASWFVKEIPTVFISIANPYHLQDVPMVSAYINAYTANEFNPAALVEKIVGKSEFKGKSPNDPFCGYWDTAY